ncbi:MAG: sigma-54 dependent transcriptional regulator, partial [Thermoanaerobaculia bacterium]|nr:sigma-54 dependent transcriptional regulator [Thermoanaerobaculia bacterium]
EGSNRGRCVRRHGTPGGFTSLSLAGGTEVRVEVGSVVLRGDLPNQETVELFRPVLEIVAALLSSARRVASGSVSEAPRSSEDPGRLPVELPDPPSVEPAVRQLYERARRVAASDVNVLILGESGTGKELLARFLHDASSRSEGPFVALNCAALPRDLQESELFGIEKGVATGVDARAGLFEQAHGGTLFLDEIGDMALEVQAKILRVLQEQEVFRLGGTKARRADVRVLSATHRDVNAMVQAGSFRTDLFHRIADWQASLPSLRERPADIPNLAAFFLGQGAKAQGRAPLGFSKAALDALCRFHWPGNIRQLEREIARGLLFTEPGEFFDCDCLSSDVRAALERESPIALATILSQAERMAITTALERADGDVPTAARHLEVAVSTLYRKIKLLELEGVEERAEST